MRVPLGRSIALAICDHVGNRDEEAARVMSPILLVSVAYAATIGGLATIVGTPPNAVFVGMLAQMFPKAPPLSFVQWMMFGVPIVLSWAQAIFDEPVVDTTKVEVSQRGAQVSSESLFGLVLGIYVVAWLANLAYASLRSSGRRTWWDRVAKTMVRYRTTRRSLAAGS